jgi:hypothetical protein
MGFTASLLVAASAAIVLLLGVIHLAYTFRGRKLHPRDPGMFAQMNEVSPVLTRETTMWQAWIGFNASHARGAIFFGLIYGYLALEHGVCSLDRRFFRWSGCCFLRDMPSWENYTGSASHFAESCCRLRSTLQHLFSLGSDTCDGLSASPGRERRGEIGRSAIA